MFQVLLYFGHYYLPSILPVSRLRPPASWSLFMFTYSVLA
jgi:hypothetical protein